MRFRSPYAPATVATLIAVGVVTSVAAFAGPATGPAVGQSAGDCSTSAPGAMPDGAGHDHADPSKHRFECELTAAATLDLKQQVPEPELFGEIDIAGDTAVMATTFPEAGFIVFDVSTPATPVVRSRFRGGRCNPKSDVDCGADVKITPDARYAFLAVQGSADRPAGVATPGIVTVDLSDPRAPKQSAFAAVPPVGVHMLAFHSIGGAGWVFARARGLGPANDRPGVAIFRVEPGGRLTKTGEIATDGAHDVMLFDDPVDKTTYLYLSGAQSGTLFVYDVGDPASPRRVGSWSPKAEVDGDAWYMHNAWTFRDGNRRYTFAGPELYRQFDPLPPGHGTVAGPLWLLDTTDHANIRIIGTWRNSSNRPAGDLTFSPHNTWYAGGGFTWTSHYHGGIWVLNWTEVMAGRATAPRVAGFHVPHTARREFVNSEAEQKFMTAEGMRTRPLMWDVVASGRFGYASDINGGLVVLQRPAPPASPAATPSFGSRPARPSPGGNGVAVAVAVAMGALLVAAVAAVARRRRPPL